MGTVYRVLARKYRPTTLKELVGQEILAQTLTQSIENNRLPHAFLLHGIRGVGKTTTARIIARALNCIGADGKGGMTPDPCGVCVSCVGISEDRHLDVIEMDAASRTGVDDIREVIESSRYKAVTGRYKIFIIDEVHMLSKSAFNALLKTLEEPPPHVKFIFATTELRKIPETILSRCMRFDLKRIEPLSLIKHLKFIAEKEGYAVEEEGLSFLARAADGSLRDALSLLDQAIALTGQEDSEGSILALTVRSMLGLSDRGRLFTLLSFLFKGDIEESLKITHEMVTDGGDPVVIMQDILDLVYWLTCLKTVPNLQNNVVWPSADREQGMEIVAPLNVPILTRSWQVLLKGFEEVNQSPSPAQALDMVLIRLCYMAEMPLLSDLIESFKGGSKQTLTSPASRPMAAPSVPIEKPQEVFPLPASFEEMVKLLERSEPLLSGNLVHYVSLVSYKPGDLTIRLADNAPPSFVQQLQLALKKITKQEWKINLSQEDGQGTLRQQKQKEKEFTQQQVLEHPVVASVKEAFPGTTVTFIE
ncbi:MAG: DNA polymerase III subunit gamma/tau [Alphaproteobacteria bacterium]|nr:DNA polymerase III subunit gamma/tau [Alphaproteobacteria bacterium]